MKFYAALALLVLATLASASPIPEQAAKRVRRWLSQRRKVVVSTSLNVLDCKLALVFYVKPRIRASGGKYNSSRLYCSEPPILNSIILLARIPDQGCTICTCYKSTRLTLSSGSTSNLPCAPNTPIVSAAQAPLHTTTRKPRWTLSRGHLGNLVSLYLDRMANTHIVRTPEAHAHA
ncbi:hypothetical protein K474DRAFT_1695014 [Panus rudis PR-1116 ss-1]|nr:hypothetical protein K474DRAFT_1695014 [Panus rudis PR-1116 ss-1]